MISAFEVGAVFKIINEASPALAAILKQVRELDGAIKKAKESLASLSFSNLKLGAAAGETEALAGAWANVAKNASAAQLAMSRASGAAASSGAAAAVGGGRNLFRPGARGGYGGGHIGGPGVGLPGGVHFRPGGGAGMAAVGLAGYAGYEAAEMEKAEWFLTYHAGQAQTAENHIKFRKILQDSMAHTGFDLKDTSDAAMQAIRMFKGTKGGGLDVLPELLEIAAKESLAKGEGLQESMKSFIGLAHETLAYTSDDIKKLAPAFAFLSTANPSRLGSIEKAASYAVPMLHSGLEIDPLTTLLLGTALTRAGATNTKSGTWLREMMVRSMPGTSLMSDKAFEKHEAALRALGLVDKNDKPTWFTNGKPDPLKMLDIAGTNAGKIPLTERAGIERQLFGAQGGGGFALLADPAVREQIRALQKEMAAPGFLNQYQSMLPDYMSGSTVQNARTAMADFNNLAMDVGQHALPMVNLALKDFKNVLEGIRSSLPGGKADALATVGGRALEGAIAGGIAGFAMGGVGALPGALIGGVTGGAFGVAEQYMAAMHEAHNGRNVRAELIQEAHNKAQQPVQAILAPGAVQLSVNLDGATIARATNSANAATFSTGAAGFDGFGLPTSGDHQYSDK